MWMELKLFFSFETLSVSGSLSTVADGNNFMGPFTTKPRERFPFPSDNGFLGLLTGRAVCKSAQTAVSIKTKIKETRKENMDKKVILQKKKKPVKLGNLKKDELRKLVMYLKNGADCVCQQLETTNLGNNYLIMGRKVGKRYLLTGIHKWDKSSKEFRKALKKMKSYKCPVYDVFK